MTHFSKYSIKQSTGEYTVGIFTGINSNQPQPFYISDIISQLQYDYPNVIVNSDTVTKRYPTGCTHDTPSSVEINT